MTVLMQQIAIEATCHCGFTGPVNAFEKQAASDLATLTWFCPKCGRGHTRLREIPIQSKTVVTQEEK